MISIHDATDLLMDLIIFVILLFAPSAADLVFDLRSFVQRQTPLMNFEVLSSSSNKQVFLLVSSVYINVILLFWFK